mmetsp:Transcript_20325/g.43370  ORF Transcript_20325/g.43370 Transcript_20325/m.43370 type:complete len:235 (+) Transcript_20325:792-1496(+)
MLRSLFKSPDHDGGADGNRPSRMRLLWGTPLAAPFAHEASRHAAHAAHTAHAHSTKEALKASHASHAPHTRPSELNSGASGHSMHASESLVAPVEKHGERVTPAATKKCLEDVICMLEGHSAGTPHAASAASTFEGGLGAQVVILLSLVRIVEDFVCFGDGLEVLLCLLFVVGILVWVILQSQLFVGLGNLVVRRGLADAQDLVVVIRVDVGSGHLGLKGIHSRWGVAVARKMR